MEKWDTEILCFKNAANSTKKVSIKIGTSAVNCVGIWSVAWWVSGCRRRSRTRRSRRRRRRSRRRWAQARPQGTREAAAFPIFAAAAPHCSCSSCILCSGGSGPGRRYSGRDPRSPFYASGPYLPTKTSPTSLLLHFTESPNGSEFGNLATRAPSFTKKNKLETLEQNMVLNMV